MQRVVMEDSQQGVSADISVGDFRELGFVGSSVVDPPFDQPDFIGCHLVGFIRWRHLFIIGIVEGESNPVDEFTVIQVSGDDEIFVIFDEFPGVQS